MRRVKRTKILCETCGKKLSRTEKELLNSKHYFCSNSCSMKFYNKNRKVSESTRLKISESLKKYFKKDPDKFKPHNKMDRIEKICPICHKSFMIPIYKNTIYCSKQCYLDDHNHQFRKQPSGGLRQGSGRGKHGWYKGYWCDSSWELAFVIYNLEHNIKFERNKIGFEYEFEGKNFKYYPDFILEDDVYVEIKGTMNKKNEQKIKSFKNKLIILDKKGIQKYLDYAKENYGDDFIKLYEGNPYNERKNVCLICGKPAKKLYCSRKCSGKAVNKLKNGVLV